MNQSKIAVVALGGNAIADPSSECTLQDQQQAAYHACEKIMGLLDEGCHLVITHGNGPQVGNILIGMEALRHFGIAPSPLDQCVAMTQGSLGYLLENNLGNVLADQGKSVRVISLLTEVEVDQHDPAFQNPVKGVGPILTQDRYELLKSTTNWVFQELPEKKYRRVVPSPKPKNVFIRDIIKLLLDQGFVCIAGGGGGIPLYRDGLHYHPVEAVIDKDLTSALLAKQLGADILIIATAVRKVCINYKKANQKELDSISLPELDQYIREGHFGKGDMLPKVMAIREFLEAYPKSEAYIVHLNDLKNFRTAGTCFYHHR